MRFVQAVKAAGIFLACLACGLFGSALSFSPVFRGGEGYELYAGTSSAPCVQTEQPFLDILRMGGVRGESVRYEGDLSGELMRTFHASLLFTEKADGVMNYYLYAPELGDCVEINGERVNLHIAVRGGRTAVGTPLIFGGF